MALSQRPLVKNTKSTKKSIQRSLVLFDNGLKSQKTIDTYHGYLTEFKKFSWINSYDDLINVDKEELQRMLEYFVIDQKNRGLSLSYISGKISALKLFFAMNDIVALNWIKLSPCYLKKRN